MVKLKSSFGAERGRRSLGTAGILGSPGREGGTLGHTPKWVGDLNIQGEKRTGILRTSLKKVLSFR